MLETLSLHPAGAPSGAVEMVTSRLRTMCSGRSPASARTLSASPKSAGNSGRSSTDSYGVRSPRHAGGHTELKPCKFRGVRHLREALIPRRLKPLCNSGERHRCVQPYPAVRKHLCDRPCTSGVLPRNANKVYASAFERRYSRTRGGRLGEKFDNRLNNHTDYAVSVSYWPVPILADSLLCGVV